MTAKMNTFEGDRGLVAYLLRILSLSKTNMDDRITIRGYPSLLVSFIEQMTLIHATSLH